MVVAYVGLGANLGPLRTTLRRAIAALGRAGRVSAVSSLWETAPLHVTEQPAFLNAVAALEVGEASPEELVRELTRIETELGRTPGPRYGPRAIDLDLLLLGGSRAEHVSEDVVVPHPRIAERRFVLEPLAELAPDELEPRSGRPVRELLGAVLGQDVRRVADGEWWKTASS